MEHFGEPWHKDNLPPFELVEGETYLVPLKLLRKERRFDGGRGTEFYVFGLDDWRKITFADYNLPEILRDERVDGNVLGEALTNPKPISEELKQMARDFGKRTTFC